MSERKIAVVLQQFGGPDSLKAVQPFLFNLFNDPDIIELPFGPTFQKALATIISKTRSKSVSLKYAEIGGKSPIVEKTCEQLLALQTYFNRHHPKENIKVYLSMRYWRPFAKETIQLLMAEGVTEVVHIPLYAQYSKTNAGSSYNEWDRVTKQLGARFYERRIMYYHRDPQYLQAMNERMNEALAKFPDRSKVQVLFSAHGTPLDMVQAGDPYSYHIQETMEALMKLRGYDLPYMLSYQSKVGPKKWLEPATTKTITELGQQGITDLLVVPIAFVSDHIETLHELDIEERHNAQANGIRNYVVMEGLNASPTFIKALADLALAEIRHLHAVPEKAIPA